MAGTRVRRLSLGATLGAIGVVYGDIGTSPLYALEQSLNATGQGGHSATALLATMPASSITAAIRTANR